MPVQACIHSASVSSCSMVGVGTDMDMSVVIGASSSDSKTLSSVPRARLLADMTTCTAAIDCVTFCWCSSAQSEAAESRSCSAPHTLNQPRSSHTSSDTKWYTTYRMVATKKRRTATTNWNLNRMPEYARCAHP